MGKMQQRKGSAAERELAKILQENGFPVRRGYVFCGEPDLVGLLSIHIECKRAERVVMSSWLEQAIIASRKYGGLPAVFSRMSRKPWLVTMREDDWRYMGGEDAECDYRAAFLLHDRMEQAKKKALFWRRQEPMITMFLDDWMELYRGWKLPFTEEEDDRQTEAGR